MKNLCFIILLTYTGIIAYADIIGAPFIPEEFDIEIYQYPHMILIENPESQHIDTHYTFTDEEENYQLRYTFFKQTNHDEPNIRAFFSFWAMINMMNVAGHENIRISNFNDNDVKNDFNGDFGTTAFIQNPTSDFSDGYDFIMINFYYKNNQGIVVQSLMMNDLSITQSPVFLEVFNSFSFID